MSIKLIIGLRNPGKQYESTRHNAGGWFAERLADDSQVEFKLEKKLQSEVVAVDIGEHSVRLMMPTTFMNHSGQSVQAVSQYYQIKPSEMLVVHDDLDLQPGRVKVKTGGGHGGHNGLRNIVQQLGTESFHRLRIGIGHPGHKELVVNYVLSKPSQHDKQQILFSIERSIDALPTILDGDMVNAMNVLNG